MTKLAVVIAGALAVLAIGAPSASAAQQIISSAGPLSNIYLDDNLACQATHVGDTEESFFGGTNPGACGTFLALGSTVYGPTVPAGQGRTPYTPVSQTPVSGAGTAASPFRVTTVVDVGSTGLRITQVDTYVVGEEAYATDVTVSNSSASPQTAVLYHAGDCYLQNSDSGYGYFDATSRGIFCSVNPNNEPAARIVGFVPTGIAAADSHYMEAGFSEVWAAINGTNFPDICECALLQDNGAGLSWSITVPAGGSTTRSFVTTFSPTGVVPDPPPDTTITAGPDDPNDTTPTFSFSSSEEGVSFECRVDGGTFTACSSPHTTAPLGGGQHTFEVRATDSGGDVDPTPASQTLTIQTTPSDTTPPETEIASGPSGLTTDSDPTFSFGSSEPDSTLECKLDGPGTAAGTYGLCTSPQTYFNLADGSYTFSVRARDAAGNVDPTPATRSFTIDTVAPETTVTSGPSGLTANRSPSFGFGSSEPGSSFECRLDGPGTATGSFTSCSSPQAYSNLADGTYTFSVRATDAAGNVDPTPVTRTFAVDATPPDTTVSSGPSGATADDHPSFSFSSSEPNSTFECRLDGPGTAVGSFGSCASPRAYFNLADGSYTFSVRARDPAGNLDPTPATRSFTLDTAPPDTTILFGPSGPTTNRSPTFGFSSSEPGATFECQLDVRGTVGTYVPCSSPHTYSNLADGSYRINVRAKDVAGNSDPTPATRIFTVGGTPPSGPPAAADTTPPETLIVAGPDGPTSDTTPTFTFSSNEPGATFECSVDGGPFVACSSPYTSPPLSEGAHTFQVRAIDAAGNVDQSPASSGDATAAQRSFTVVDDDAIGRPTLGRSVNAEPIGDGPVFVSLPAGGARASASVPGLKGRRFIPLRQARQLPVGSIFDTRRGRVRLTTARNRSGATQAGQFTSGVFQVLQSRRRAARGLTELRLRGASFRSCPSARRGRRSTVQDAQSRRRRIRRLRGNGRGRFRTRGRYSAATVRGTVWTVTDRCDGTLTQVRRGRVAVRDFRRRRTITLRAGRSYLARPRR